jgi:hypothetical protein
MASPACAQDRGTSEPRGPGTTPPEWNGHTASSAMPTPPAMPEIAERIRSASHSTTSQRTFESSMIFRPTPGDVTAEPAQQKGGERQLLAGGRGVDDRDQEGDRVPNAAGQPDEGVPHRRQPPR